MHPGGQLVKFSAQRVENPCGVGFSTRPVEKVGKLTHQDIGQMDTYVRMFEAHEKLPADNPTIGLILCSTKNEAVAKYSVLQESRQLFAARYLKYLPPRRNCGANSNANRA